MKNIGDDKVVSVLKDYVYTKDPLTKISKRHNVSVATIMRKVREYGVPRRLATHVEHPEEIIKKLEANGITKT